MLEVSNTLDFSKFSSINLKKSDSICDAFLFSLFNENERKITDMKTKQQQKSIIKDRHRRTFESPRVTRDLNWAKLVAQLNEQIQHRESDFAMFYHKDKDMWIALVLSIIELLGLLMNKLSIAVNVLTNPRRALKHSSRISWLQYKC